MNQFVGLVSIIGGIISIGLTEYLLSRNNLLVFHKYLEEDWKVITTKLIFFWQMAAILIVVMAGGLLLFQGLFITYLLAGLVLWITYQFKKHREIARLKLLLQNKVGRVHRTLFHHKNHVVNPGQVAFTLENGRTFIVPAYCKERMVLRKKGLEIIAEGQYWPLHVKPCNSV